MYPEKLKEKIELYCKNNNINLENVQVTILDNVVSTYHFPIKVKISDPKIEVNFKQLESGCGIILMYFFISSAEVNEKVKPIFDAIFDFYVENNVGTFICTLGSDWFKYEKVKFNLESLGFKEIAHYDNLYHAEGDTQKLYIKSINREYFTNNK